MSVQPPFLDMPRGIDSVRASERLSEGVAARVCSSDGASRSSGVLLVHRECLRKCEKSGAYRYRHQKSENNGSLQRQRILEFASQ